MLSTLQLSSPRLLRVATS